MSSPCSPCARRSNRRWRGLLLAAILATAGCLAFHTERGGAAIGDEKQPVAADAEGLSNYEETWQVIYIGKSRVGWGLSSTGHKTRNGSEIVVTDTELALVISRIGQVVKIKMNIRIEETTEGSLREFSFEMNAPPAQSNRSHGRVEDGSLVIETETNGKTRTTKQPWDGSIKSPAMHERLLRENPMKPGEERSFKAFVPEMGQTSTFSLKAGKYEDVQLLDGKKVKLLNVAVTQSIPPGTVTHDYVDARGVIQKSTTGMSGLQMTIYKVAKEEALKALSGEEVDMVVTTLVKVRKIERPQETKSAVYRVKIPGDDPQKTLAAGPSQKINRISPDTVDLTVTALAPPNDPANGAETGPGDEFVLPNSFVQSDDELVRKEADAAAGQESDPWKAAQLMEHWVFENIKKKNFSTLLASAAEVAQSLSGDCTEHAVLLAAMARARHIPSRVAVGLVYAPSLSSFGGHMWTEVFVRGAWIPLDATIGRGRVAADHIKFSDSSLADEGSALPVSSFLPLVSVLGKIKIEVREVKYE